MQGGPGSNHKTLPGIDHPIAKTANGSHVKSVMACVHMCSILADSRYTCK
jgi:hypothetical protein